MKRRRDAMRWTSAVVLLGASSVTVASCAGGKFSTTSGSCADQIDSCPQGEVCWPTMDGFQCLKAPSSGGTEGAQCDLTMGVPTCAHGFFCFTDRSRPELQPQCSPRCEPPDDGPCSNTAIGCRELTVVGLDLSIGVCVP
jgi:hypothetical protein